MTTASYAGLAAIGLFPAGMIYAGFMDLRTMRIPNGIIVFLFLDFMLAATLAGWGIQEIGVSLAVGLSVLLCTAVLFSFGLIGGGDAKLAGVAALWTGPDHVLAFLAYTALIGGALALLMLLFRALALPFWLTSREWIARIHSPGSDIPYGVALGLAALLVFPATEIAIAFF